MKALLATGALLAAAANASAAPPRDLDRTIEARLQHMGTPGMAVSIVENGVTTLARGYGVKKLGGDDRVTPDTIFATGSTGKAVTVAALAILVDEGRIGWDDKVTDHLRDFQMYDPWVTREITIRDLLVHRSGLGLGAGDLLFMPSTNLSRAESVRRLRYLKPATSFRSGYAYDNVLYMVAGQLIEAVSGQSWEVFVRERLLKPAGMTTSTTDGRDQRRTADRALPHARLNGAVRGAGDQQVLAERETEGRNSAPAGGIASSAKDMARWLRILLAEGALPEGGRLYSKAQAVQMFTPQVQISIEPAPVAALTPQFQSYALGWIVRDWRGHRILMHSGSVAGMRAMVVLIPEKNTGFSILENAEDAVPLTSTTYELLDHYLGYPKFDWQARLERARSRKLETSIAGLQAATASLPKTSPSLPAAGYAGTYADPWYGPVAIGLQGDLLTVDFRQSPGMTGVLEHVRYDTFRTRWTDRSIEDAYMTFHLNAEGAVERIRLKAVSPLADFSYDYQDLDLTPVAGGR